ISSTALIITLAFIPEKVFVFFLGNGFLGVKTLMLAYAPAILMMSVFTVINQYFSGIGKQKFILLSNTFGFLATLALAPLLISRFDTLGAAYTANISYVVIFMMSLIMFLKSTKIRLIQFFEIRNDFVFFKRLIKNESDF
ncbi:MAG: polysaccharide biosynthesis C-terminal domain-containing protein, partial [Bacteroidota bacterium]